MNYLFLLICATLSLALPTPVKRNIFQTAPLDDPFYKAPDNLTEYNNGDIFRSRKVNPDFALQASFSGVYQVAYKTTDVKGNPSHTIATVFKPLFPSDDPKIFSYQIWEDSVELNCSPSYTLVKGFLSPDWVTGAYDTLLAIDFGLINGWYVVVPDHEGPLSAFLEGYTQGQNGLDGIQATINFLDLPQDTPAALYGYSGGASATVWMTNLHDTYAPNINIVGAAHGGTPIDLSKAGEGLSQPHKLFSGFIAGALAGILNAYPEVNDEIWPYLGEELRKDITTLRTPNNCVTADFLLRQNHSLSGITNDTSKLQPLYEIFSRESLLKNVSTGIVETPKFPRYIFHAEGDGVLPIGPVEQYVEQQCADGANIQWVPWKGNDHITMEIFGIPDAFQFILQAMNGTTPNVKCGTASNDILTVASEALGDTLGQLLADIIRGLSDMVTSIDQEISD